MLIEGLLDVDGEWQREREEKRGERGGKGEAINTLYAIWSKTIEFNR